MSEVLSVSEEGNVVPLTLNEVAVERVLPGSDGIEGARYYNETEVSLLTF